MSPRDPRSRSRGLKTLQDRPKRLPVVNLPPSSALMSPRGRFKSPAFLRTPSSLGELTHTLSKF